MIRATFNTFATASLMIVLMASVVGCSSTLTKDVEHKVNAGNSEFDSRVDALRRAKAGPLVTHDDTPRFAGLSVPYVPPRSFPGSQRYVEVYNKQRLSMVSAAEFISRAIDIPVVVTPDALLDVSKFYPVGADAVSEGGGVSDAGPEVVQAFWSLSADEALNSVKINYSGTVGGLLDHVCNRAGLYWEYDAGLIRIKRVVTRAISIAAITGALQASSQVTAGQSGSVSSNISNDYWGQLESSLQLLVSPAGSLNVDLASGIVTVSDAVWNVRAVERALAERSELVLRQVALDVTILSLRLDDEFVSQFSMSLLNDALGNLILPETGSFSSSPSQLVFDQTRASGSERFNAVVKFLSKYGNVSTEYSSVFHTLNRQTVPVTSFDSRSYLAQSTTTVSDGVSQTSLSPGSVSTGFSLLITPVVLNSNRVLLETNVAVSSLANIDVFSGGGQSIQLPNVREFQSMQRAFVDAGNTLLLVAVQSEDAGSDGSSVGAGGPPLSSNAKNSRSRLIVLITPRIVGAENG